MYKGEGLLPKKGQQQLVNFEYIIFITEKSQFWLNMVRDKIFFYTIFSPLPRRTGLPIGSNS